jgi:hypothetical protein
MASIHTIRLAGPWQYEPLARSVRASAGVSESTADLPPPGRIDMPADWAATLGADFRGRVRFRRSFGRPTGLEPSDRVWLVLERIDARGVVSLNGSPLGETSIDSGPTRFDVTALLAVRNELVIEVELPDWPADEDLRRRGDRAGQVGGVIGEVRLEIHGAA